MVLAALAEVAGAALAGDERNRRPHALLGPLVGRPQPLVEIGGAFERLDRGDERVDHRLVAGLRLAACLHALQGRAPRGGPAGQVDPFLPGQSAPHLQEQRAVERPRGAADARHERHGHGLEHGAGVGRVGRLELLHRLAHAAVHVHAVVAVADRRVETDELLSVLVHLAGEAAHPVHDGVAGDRHCSTQPQRKAGVFTGASQ